MINSRFTSTVSICAALLAWGCSASPQQLPDTAETERKTVPIDVPTPPPAPQVTVEDADKAINEAQETALGGDLTSAEERLKTTLAGLSQNDPNTAKRIGDIQYNLGLLAEWQGRYSQARRQYESALEVQPELGSAVVAVGRLMLRSGDAAGAVNYARGRLVGRQKSILGYTIPNPCVTCSGRGAVAVQATVSIPVPSGVASGQTLRLDGEGHAGHCGGQTGDLYVDISVAIHPFFERRGDDIICEVPISFPQAALGTTIEVPTLTGKAKVKVPAGTQSGKSLRLRGKGLPQVASRGVGDQLIRLQIETPTKLNEEQRALLEQFETITAGRSDHLSKQRSFLDKLKDLFG